MRLQRCRWRMLLEPGLTTQDEEDVGGSRETEEKGNMGGAQKVIVLLF